MKDILFIANDPGGFDVIYPVASKMAILDEPHVDIILAGRAAEKLPILRKSSANIVDFIEKKVSRGDDFVLVTGTSWTSTVELEAIKLCKEHEIVTVSILDYWCNYSERFKFEGGYIFPDLYYVMDELASKEAQASGVDPKIIKIVGNPGLDRLVSKKSVSRKKVLFISQPLSELYGDENDGYTEFDAFEGVIIACKELKVTPYIKFHPHETEKMKDLYGKYSVDGDIEEIARDFDVIVGMTTMGLLQGSLIGIPVINYEPNLNKDSRCIITKLGIVEGAYSYDDLLSQLRHITGAVDNKSFPFWFDGKSTERCVNELMKLAEMK